jgi:hypothetical protein
MLRFVPKQTDLLSNSELRRKVVLDLPFWQWKFLQNLPMPRMLWN